MNSTKNLAHSPKTVVGCAKPCVRPSAPAVAARSPSGLSSLEPGESWDGPATPLKRRRIPRPTRRCWPCAKPRQHWGRGVCWQRRSTSLWNLAPCALGPRFWPECHGWSSGPPIPNPVLAVRLRNVAEDPRLNHRCQVRGGVLERECAELLKGFFCGPASGQVDWGEVPGVVERAGLETGVAVMVTVGSNPTLSAI